MRQFYIGFSRPVKFKIGAWLIEKWTRANFSHAYVRFESQSLGISTVYQASHGMVHFCEINRFMDDNEVVREYPLEISNKDYSEILRECMELAGEEYSKMELAKIVAYDVMNTLGIKIDPGDSRGYICSELVGRILKRLNIKFDKPQYLLTPKDIDNALSK